MIMEKIITEKNPNYLKNKDYARRITEWINTADSVFREYKIKIRKI